MDGPNLWWEDAPLLLLISPAIGFMATAIAAGTRPNFVRPVAAGSTVVTVLILAGLAGQYAMDLSLEAKSRVVSADDLAEAGTPQNAQEMVHRRVDKLVADRRTRQSFNIDGLNLWPVFVLVVIAGVVTWQPEHWATSSKFFVPTVFIFETASIGALTANDLRAFLWMDAACVLAMSVLIACWAGRERRQLAERFVIVQFCGGMILMLGIAMLAVAVPWMKIEDAPAPATISWNLSKITYEIQKWTTNNERSFQYAHEVLPWTLFILSVGFAIQFGLFPFQTPHFSVLNAAPSGICALYAAGLLPIWSIGWLRFVMPLAPDVLVGLAWWMLVPAVCGASWAAVHSLVAQKPRQRAVSIFSSLFGLSLLGSFLLDRVGIGGAWLMQQQLTISFCVTVLVCDSSETGNWRTSEMPQHSSSALTVRTLLLMLCVPALGLFASGSILLSALFRESLFLPLVSVVVVSLLAIVIYWAVIDRIPKPGTSRLEGWIVVVGSLAVIANLFPGWMLMQCEPELARVLRRFEPPTPATSAESVSIQRQTLP